MKEAAGEANLTVITVVLIGVVAAVGLLLVPKLMDKVQARACCTDAGRYVSGVYCCGEHNGDSCGSKYRLGKRYMETAAAFSACWGK